MQGQIDVSQQAKDKLEVQALDVTKVKDITAIKLKPDAILIETVNKLKSGLIIPDTKGMSSVSAMKIIKVGAGVKVYEVGDLVLDIISQNQLDYLYSKQEDGETRRFLLTNEYNINIAVSEDNYEL